MRLMVLGLGYSAEAFVRQGGPLFSHVAATVRSPQKAEALRRRGIEAHAFDGGAADNALVAAIDRAGALLVSIPAEDGGDPALAVLSEAIAAARQLRWIGYLSTVGVYGDHQGAWVDEGSALRAASRRGLNRIAAEQGWLDLGAAAGKPTQIFRLAGIYGPGRNQLVGLRGGTARRIVKPGQLFSRIHVEDIAGACLAGLARPDRGRIWNVADDEPAPPQDVVAHAAALLGIAPPPEEPFETAELSPMARSFYLDSRRVSNERLRTALGYRFRFPTYREGLKALFEAGEGR
ncbi:MAG: SDR family oxidoreductase [Bosea sp.]|jgi:nucleoside-diphosphate-sugar epimerase|nr:SDR family oxidoreductase [Bosea sp. (in: a-proteobacteria)]